MNAAREWFAESTCNLRSCLTGADRVAVIQDGNPIITTSIIVRADNLTVRLRRLDAGRVALASQRADVVIAALAACQAAQKQLLLLRESYPVDDPIWATWGIGCLLDDELRETPLVCGGSSAGKTGVLLMTSGTTGTPKVVLHDLERLLGRIRPARDGASAERWLLTYHPASFAGMQVLLTTLSSRSQLVATNRQTMSLLAETALQYLPTHISGTPTFWRSFVLAVGPGSSQLPLQQITIGGEAVDQLTLDQLRAAFPTARVSHIYASTEAGALFAVKDGRAGFPAQWLQDGIEGVQLRIQEGVLEVLSPRAMHSYLAGGPQQRGGEGWIVTGDIVEVVGDRVLFRGRLDDVINVGGAKVMPEQVESALLKVPCVREARVYGLRNPLSGALVAADIVLANAEEENAARRQIVQQLSASLESYKLPRIINFVTTIPINAMGKKTRKP